MAKNRVINLTDPGGGPPATYTISDKKTFGGITYIVDGVEFTKDKAEKRAEAARRRGRLARIGRTGIPRIPYVVYTAPR